MGEGHVRPFAFDKRYQNGSNAAGLGEAPPYPLRQMRSRLRKQFTKKCATASNRNTGTIEPPSIEHSNRRGMPL
jgi:hypothetical protein